MKTSITSLIKKVTRKSVSKEVATPAVSKVAVKKTVAKKVITPKKAAVTVAKKIPAKKVAVKKVVAKKTTGTKVSSLKKLVVASDKHSFWLNDGQILNDIVALKNAFHKMENKVYTYHTKNGRHDFANWVEDVLHDKPLAEALRKTKTPKSAHTVVIKHLRLYQF